jgi:hypothetical protein
LLFIMNRESEISSANLYFIMNQESEAKLFFSVFF